MATTLSEPATQFVRARSASQHATSPRLSAQTAVRQADFEAITRHMFSLMFRNVSSDGFVVAAPSYPASLPGVDQDYVFNWTRDAAITAMELAAAAVPARPAAGVQPLIDY